MTAPPRAHLDRQQRGRAGESAAVALLRRADYVILEQNVRLGRVELDIVGRDGDEIAFVEVKARWSDQYGAPEDAVTPSKRRNLIRAALEYLRLHDLEDRPWRIDVLALRLRGTRVLSWELFRNAIEDE